MSHYERKTTTARRPLRSGSPGKVRLVELVSRLNRQVRAMRLWPAEGLNGRALEMIEERETLEQGGGGSSRRARRGIRRSR